MINLGWNLTQLSRYSDKNRNANLLETHSFFLYHLDYFHILLKFLQMVHNFGLGVNFFLKLYLHISHKASFTTRAQNIILKSKVLKVFFIKGTSLFRLVIRLMPRNDSQNFLSELQGGRMGIEGKGFGTGISYNQSYIPPAIISAGIWDNVV